MITKAYLSALQGLYGDSPPASTKKMRSSRYGQKKRHQGESEKVVQMQLVSWLKNYGIPVLSIPNEGNRGRIATHNLKLMGLWPGASDLFIPRASASGRYHGFFLELKSKGKKPKDNQLEFMQVMQREGYHAAWFDDIALARQAILDYLQGVMADV